MDGFLASWRAIVSHCDPNGNPSDNHIELINDRVQELDAAGFVWNKHSIIDLLHRLGPSPTPSLTLCETSRSTDQLIPGDPPTQSNPPGLLSLPLEILEKIIEFIRASASLEYDSVQSKRGVQHARAEYTFQYEGPILTSHQSFAVVNKAMYQLCRTWLWKNLTLPPYMTMPEISMWINNVLPRHGSLAQSLTLVVDPDSLAVTLCMTSRVDWHEIKPTSELRALSPGIVFSILAQCPNVSKLKVSFYGPWDDEEALETNPRVRAFTSRLSQILSRMTHFRQLDIEGTRYMDDEVLAPFFEALPLLESISCGNFYSKGDSLEIFGWQMSQLKNLTRMYLLQGYSIDGSWCRHSWTGSLTDVSIMSCPNLTPIEFHKLIHHIAPNVIKLKYDLGYYAKHFAELDEEIEPRWNSVHRFNLPALTDLYLFVDQEYESMIHGFVSCKNLERLTYGFLRSFPGWSILSKLMARQPWPKLDFIRLILPDSLGSQTGAEDSTFEEAFRVCCLQAGIAVFDRAHDRYKPFDHPF